MADKSIGERYNNQDYLTANPDWGASHAPWKARIVGELVERRGLDVDSIAEVGCGSGAVLEQLQQRWPGKSFTGYDLSSVAHEIARPRAKEGLDYRLEDLTAADAHYDLLLCLDVVEHVENSFGFLRQIRDKADWHVFHIPLELTASTILRGRLMAGRHSVGHLHYYTRETALAQLEECGFHIVSEQYSRPFARDGVHAPTLKRRLANLVRRATFRLAPHLVVRAIGGASLLVLARPDKAGS